MNNSLPADALQWCSKVYNTLQHEFEPVYCSLLKFVVVCSFIMSGIKAVQRDYMLSIFASPTQDLGKNKQYKGTYYGGTFCKPTRGLDNQCLALYNDRLKCVMSARKKCIINTWWHYHKTKLSAISQSPYVLTLVTIHILPHIFLN